jgi:hypothetical protein
MREPGCHSSALLLVGAATIGTYVRLRVSVLDLAGALAT